jgi:hypothetical protein
MCDPFKSPSLNRIRNSRRTTQFVKFLFFVQMFYMPIPITSRQVFMMYAIEMASGGVMYTHQVSWRLVQALEQY